LRTFHTLVRMSYLGVLFSIFYTHYVLYTP
jgi:hypothetical protein